MRDYLFVYVSQNNPWNIVLIFVWHQTSLSPETVFNSLYGEKMMNIIHDTKVKVNQN